MKAVVNSPGWRPRIWRNVGAVCGNWWCGENDGFQEGYARLDFSGDQVEWSYIDYGWEVDEECTTKELLPLQSTHRGRELRDEG